jgi:SPP1 gp7 family putative phage head morphogenesis protein
MVLDFAKRSPRQRAAQAQLRAALARRVAAFLRAQAPKIAAQVQTLRTRVHKAAETPDEHDAVERILQGLDFTGWAILTGEVEDVLADIVKDGGYAALTVARVGVSARYGAEGVVNAYAERYAKERAAELVGMRYDEIGRIFPNPNAEWRIDDTTRDMLRGLVSDAITGGWSNDKLADEIGDAYAFSSDRAMVIARTETQLASNSGALAGYKASGVVAAKQWVTAEDDLVEEECLANAAAGANGDGILPLDDDYPSGDDAPPAHPNCRCVIVPVVLTEQEAA